MPATPALVSRGRFGLGLRDGVLLLLAELAGCGVGVGGRRLLVGERLLEVRLVGLRELLLADVGVRHFLVGLVLAGLEVELFGRRRLRCGTRRGNRVRRPLLLGTHRGDRLGHRLGRVGRGRGGGLDVLGRPLLTLGHQTLDLALHLAGLARLRVVVGLLQGLRRLRLDGRLDRRDERLLVERARLLGVHCVDLGRLGLPRHVVGRSQRGVLGLLGLRRRRRVCALVLGEALDLAGDLFEGLILVGSNGFRRYRRLQQLVGRQRERRPHPPPPAAARRGALPPRATPIRLRLGGFGRRLAEWADRRHRLGRRHRLFRRNRRRTEAGRRHSERRRRRLGAFQVDGNADPLGRLEPFLHGVDRGLVAAQLLQRRVDVRDGLLAGPPHPGSEQRVDRRVAGGALQRRRTRLDLPRRGRGWPCVSHRQVRR